MHRRFIALLLIIAIAASGCISGQTIQRQAAEPANDTNYYEIEPEPIQTQADCRCPGYVKVCPDGTAVRCQGQCVDDSCVSCSPDCTGHELTGSCAYDADCPNATNCTRYFCEGTPKTCKTYVLIPCSEQQISNQNTASTQPVDHSSQTQPEQPPQQPDQPPAQTASISIAGISQKAPEFVEIKNTGDGSQSLSGWSISDETNSSSHTFTFSDITLSPGSAIKLHTEAGTDSSTDIYWGRNCAQGNYFGCIWNDDGDTATLKDSSGNVVSVYSY